MLFIHHLIGESSQYLREEAATGIVSSLKIQTHIYLTYSGWEFLHYSNLPPSNSPRFGSQLLSNTHDIPYVRYDPNYAPCSGSADLWSHGRAGSEHYALNLGCPSFSSSIPTPKLHPQQAAIVLQAKAAKPVRSSISPITTSEINFNGVGNSCSGNAKRHPRGGCSTDPRKLILALVRYWESAPRCPACLKERELGAGGIRNQQERKIPDFT